MAKIACAALLVAGASATSLRTQSQFTVEDKIKINGNVVAEGSGISDVLGCQT